MKQIDILVPCYNEEAVLPQFYQRTCAVIDALPDYAFTFIFVNDGSRDQTLPILRQLHEKDKRVAYVSLSRNFGKEAAMLAGMDYAEGDALVIMDADLQDPPELLPDMIAWWEKGYRDVSARRRRREGETFFKKWSSHVYYRLLKKLSPVPVQEDVGDFRLLDRRCVKALRSLRECQRYTKGLFSWIGFEKKEILFDRPPRAATGRPGLRARPSGTTGSSSTWPSTALPASRRRLCASPPLPAVSWPSSPPSISSSSSCAPYSSAKTSQAIRPSSPSSSSSAASSSPSWASSANTSAASITKAKAARRTSSAKAHGKRNKSIKNDRSVGRQMAVIFRFHHSHSSLWQQMDMRSCMGCIRYLFL